MVADIAKAPYADIEIPLFFSSITGMKYRVFNCMECGQPFLERQGDMLYRLNDSDRAAEVHIIDGVNMTVQCGKCSQLYVLNASTNIIYEANGPSLYMHPQSIYLVPVPNKRLRYLHCLECGSAFHSISDRISSMSDNRIPMEYVALDRLGPIETRCTQNKCYQQWAIIV